QQRQRIAAVPFDAVGLMERPLVPEQAQPLEAVEDRADHRVAGPFAVRVLDAQDEDAPVVAGQEPVEQRGPRAADVQEAGGRGREPHADRSVAHGTEKLFRARTAVNAARARSSAAPWAEYQVADPSEAGVSGAAAPTGARCAAAS